MDVQGRRVVVTGGFGALGREVGRTLAAAGAKLALLDRAEAPGGIVEKTGAALALGSVDLTDAGAADAAIAEAVSALGGLDALVNVAGAFRWETLADGDVATWDFLYAANVKTAVCASKAALPHLATSKAGRIVNIGAGAAAKAAAGMGAYAASKSGVAKLTEALAEEQKARGITVNAILPSIIDTPANRKDMPDADFAKWVTPAEIAEAIGFLISDAARGITGALIAVPGRV
jgi:NAD(P)-dependent dehydrogenase (short-subunit alcohol dehydrogenase family)